MTDPLLSFLAARDCTVPQIGLLQPADPFLDTAGEDLRRRIYLTTGQRGEALCLRPEFTIPVCLHHLAHDGAPARYAYCGTVFRQRQDEPAEFRQAGIEDIGNADRIAADVASIADLTAAMDTLAVENWSLVIGDQAVFEAALSRLGLPPAWRKRLGRAFGDVSRLRADVERLANGGLHAISGLAPQIAKAVEAGDRTSLEGQISGMIADAGLPQSGGRTAAEIAARVLEKAELAAARLGSAQSAALDAFLGVSTPVLEAAAALSKIGRDHGLELDGALETFAARVSAMQAAGLPMQRITYRSSFGRRLDYYTGLIFEVTAPGVTKPVAGGGRYDRLLNLLGASESIPAIGFSIWLDRIARANGGAA
jgi:ATP phosphoribosyltransferase regulatory subunit